MAKNKEFDYAGALAELEALAKKVEDSATALSEIDACIERSNELISRCREYLRERRSTIDSLQ